MNDCTFCRIIDRLLPSSILFEDPHVICFLDIHPINPGHTLVVPKRHVEFFTDLSPSEAAHLSHLGQVMGRHLKASISDCAGLTFSLAEGKAANQDVPHAHLHVIPRNSGDGFGWKFPPGYGPRASIESLSLIADRITSNIKKTG